MQRRKRWSSRIAAVALSAAMVFTMTPSVGVMAASTGNAENVSAGLGLCEHHPEHTAECGYAEGEEGKPCTHVHTDDCYESVEDCVHVHTAECYPGDDDVEEASPSNATGQEPTECPHVCSEEDGCITKELNCQHEHDEDCGYTAAEPGEPCGYVCEICNAENPGEEKVTEPEESQYPACSDIEESNLILDELLAAEKAVADPDADKDSGEYQEALEKDDALWEHVDGCGICQEQLAEGGAYYEKFYETQTLAAITGDGSSFENGILTVTSNDGTRNWRYNNYAYTPEDIVKIIISSPVSEIRAESFNGCTNVTEIELPDTLTKIGKMAFYNCQSLTAITIPASVSTIDRYAFKNCSGLSEIVFKGDVPTIDTDCFAVAAEGTVSVPNGMSDAYKSVLANAGLTFGAGNWTISEAAANVVAQYKKPGSDWTKVGSLADAITAIGSDSGEIQLLKDISSTVTFNTGGTITLDLNGMTITDSNKAVTVTDNTSLTLKGSGSLNVDNNLNGSSLEIGNAAVTIDGAITFNRGVIIVNNGTLDGSNIEFTVNSSTGRRPFQIENSTVKNLKARVSGGLHGMSISGSSNVTITGGEYYGSKAGLIITGSDSTVKLTGGVFKVGQSDSVTAAAIRCDDMSLGDLLGEGCNYYMGGDVVDLGTLTDDHKLGDHENPVTVKSLTHTITFNANGGSVSPASAVTDVNGKLTSLPTPTYSGMNFKGWFTEATGGTAVTTATVYTADTTIYAQWTSAPSTTYTITFDANGGSVSPASSVTGTDGKLTSLPAPTYSGMNFKGWFTAATGGTAVTTATVYTANTTIYAHWTSEPTYRVTVNGSYATVPGAGSYEAGETVSIHAGTRSGYTFTGWTGSVTFADANSADTTFVMPADNATVTANWSYNGGSSSGGGSSHSSSATTYQECLPKNYKGGTKILHNVRVPDYVVEGNWKAVGDGRWRLGRPDGTDYAGTWVAAYNPYANASSGQMVFDWFLFDTEGYLITGWYTDEQGNTYYLNPSANNAQGAMFFGWNIIDGKYYYFNEEPDGARGKLYRNTTTPDGYYVDENGVWDGIQK